MATRYQKFIGGLLGEDVEAMGEEERKKLSREGTTSAILGMLGGSGLLGGLGAYGEQRAARRQRIEDEKVAQDIRQAQAAIASRLGAGGIGVSGGKAFGVGADVGEQTQLEEVRPLSGMNLQGLLATPEGAAALKANPMLQKMVESRISPQMPSLTDDQREYMAAVSQGYAGSFMDYLRDIKSAGATRVSLSTGEKGESKAQEVLAGAEATALSNDRNAARSSLRVWGGAQTLIDLSAKPGAVAGSLAPGVMGANDFLVSIFGRGVAPEAMADAAKFNAAVSQLVIDQMSTLGGARGFSREETALLERSFPQIATSPQARIAIARLLQAKAEENINAYNQSLSDFREAFPGVRTSLKPVELPKRNTAPPPGSRPAGNIRTGG